MLQRTLGGGVLMAALLLSSVAAPCRGADLKVGFIDSERIFAEYQGTKEARSELNAQLDQWNRELDAKKESLRKLQEEYESQALILSEPKRREREQEIQDERSKLDAFVQEIWGPTGKAAKRNEELIAPIVERIRAVLHEIGSSEGFSIIFDATDGNVVYADDALDLTDRVLAALNEQPAAGP